MERTSYTLAAQVENVHWWFEGRRRVLRSALESVLEGAEASTAILEAGCGNGGNLALLSEFGRVSAFELDSEARSRAESGAIGRVELGSLPHDVPFPPASFDLVVALDVVEHVEDDQAAVRGLAERVRPGGHLLLTVPALPWLWSEHDTLSHHKRRYTADAIETLFECAGLTTEHVSYFNTLLFPFAVAHIKLQRALRLSPYSALRTPPRWQNEILGSIFSLERHLAPRFKLPFGVSLLAWAKKKSTS